AGPRPALIAILSCLSGATASVTRWGLQTKRVSNRPPRGFTLAALGRRSAAANAYSPNDNAEIRHNPGLTLPGASAAFVQFPARLSNTTSIFGDQRHGGKHLVASSDHGQWDCHRTAAAGAVADEADAARGRGHAGARAE